MNKLKPKTVAVILAGGNSERLSSYSVPKQLIKLNGRYVINYCLDIYQRMSAIDSIILVINDNFRPLFETIVNEGGYTKLEKIVSGGRFRQDSVFNGLSSIDSCDLVAIQNGVSIFTPDEFISECINKAMTHKAVSAFRSEIYSSFIFEGDKLSERLDRNVLGHVRDPQVFDFDLLLNLHKRARKENKGPFSNDVFLLKEFGYGVSLIKSPQYNFKITTDIDIDLARLLMSNEKASQYSTVW